jgi:hypothetical protein
MARFICTPVRNDMGVAHEKASGRSFLWTTFRLFTVTISSGSFPPEPKKRGRPGEKAGREYGGQEGGSTANGSGWEVSRIRIRRNETVNL